MLLIWDFVCTCSPLGCDLFIVFSVVGNQVLWYIVQHKSVPERVAAGRGSIVYRGGGTGDLSFLAASGIINVDASLSLTCFKQNQKHDDSTLTVQSVLHDDVLVPYTAMWCLWLSTCENIASVGRMHNEWVDVFRPHRLHAVNRCGLLLPMSHVAWSVCLSVLSVLGTRVSCGETAEPIEMLIWGLTQGFMYQMGFQIPTGRSPFEERYVCRTVVTHLRVSAFLRTVYLPPLKCICPVHMADECIHCREGWQDGDAPFCESTLDICFFRFLHFHG